MPQLVLKVIEEKESGRGCLEIYEQRSMTCKARVGMVVFESQADKQLLIDSLLDGGKNGRMAMR